MIATVLLLHTQAYGLVASPTALRTVAIAGDPAPGTPAGVLFRDFNSPTLNDQGLVALRGRLTGPGIDENSSWGAWSEGGGSLHVLGRAGQPAPSGGVFSDNIVTPQFNDLGDSFFWADIANGTLYSEQNGVYSRLAGPGTQAAGAATGVTYGPIFAGTPTFPVNNLDQYLLVTTLSGPGVGDNNRHGLWIGQGTSHQLVARTGDPAPGTEPGTFFVPYSSDIFAQTPALAPNGVVAFTGRVNGPSAPSTGREGVWVGAPGSLSLAMRSGPQSSLGVSIFDFSGAIVNAAGDVVVNAAANNFFDRGVYVSRDGAVEEIARRNGPAVGGGVYSAVQLPVMNGSGDVAFAGEVNNASGVWKESNRTLEAVILPMEPAPGGTPGERLGLVDEIAINDRGQVAFIAGTNLGRGGIWAEDASGVLRKIVLEGDLVEYRPGQFGKVGEIGFSDFTGFAGSQDGYASGFNALGQVAFTAQIDGRQGVFISNLVAVPEPMSLALGASSSAWEWLPRGVHGIAYANSTIIRPSLRLTRTVWLAASLSRSCRPIRRYSSSTCMLQKRKASGD